MYLYEYPFGDAVGDFVVIGLHDDKVLIYSLSNKRFFLAMAPVVECCKPLHDDAGITTQDLIHAYEKLKEWFEAREYVQQEPGQQALLKACQHFYETRWKFSEEFQSMSPV